MAKNKISKKKGPAFVLTPGGTSLTRRKVIRRHATVNQQMVVGVKTVIQYSSHVVAKGTNAGQMRINQIAKTVDKTTNNPRNRQARIAGVTVGDSWKMGVNRG